MLLHLNATVTLEEFIFNITTRMKEPNKETKQIKIIKAKSDGILMKL